MAGERDACVDFGRRLRSLRLERGLSQERLGELASLDRTYISQAEAGRRNVTLVTIDKLAKALGVEGPCWSQEGFRQLKGDASLHQFTSG